MEEKVKIKNSKGQNIAAVIHKPRNSTGRLAILSPGFLYSKDHPDMLELAKNLSLQGFTAVRYDPTGTWESEGEISDYTSAQYLDDVKSVKEFMLREQKYKFILLGGRSRGGRMSIIYAAKDKDISCVVAIVPSALSKPRPNDERKDAKETGFKTSIRELPGEQGKFKEFTYSEALTSGPDYSALAEVSKISIPVIFIAGELDKIVPAEEVKSIFYKANEPKKFFLLPIGHDYWDTPEHVKLVNKIVSENI